MIERVGDGGQTEGTNHNRDEAFLLFRFGLVWAFNVQRSGLVGVS